MQLHGISFDRGLNDDDRLSRGNGSNLAEIVLRDARNRVKPSPRPDLDSCRTHATQIHRRRRKRSSHERAGDKPAGPVGTELLMGLGSTSPQSLPAR